MCAHKKYKSLLPNVCTRAFQQVEKKKINEIVKCMSRGSVICGVTHTNVCRLSYIGQLLG